VAVSGQLGNRRTTNAKALAAFGVAAINGEGAGLYRVIREGGKVTLFTVGYERRTGEELMSVLRDAGIAHLADIRDKPVSRKPDFRAAALRAFCEEARIEYGAWPDLGSTAEQRDQLHASGDLERFHRVFRTYAQRNLGDSIDRLASVAQKKVVAMLCYERAHEECHRSVVSDLLADKLGAGITAIL
jgi:uncharacterized protein (DUF488 family)